MLRTAMFPLFPIPVWTPPAADVIVIPSGGWLVPAFLRKCRSSTFASDRGFVELQNTNLSPHAPQIASTMVATFIARHFAR